MKIITIGNRKIGHGNPVFIIGELSCNHRGDIQVAKDSILKMHEIGVDCVKLQTLRPEKLTLDCAKDDFVIKGGTLWDGRALIDLYRETYTPWEWHEELFKLIDSLGMQYMSSPFDLEAVDFLESLNIPAYKIASFEISDIPLIEKVAKTGKPIIISTGVAELDDIELAIETCLKEGNNDLILLKCTSAYPTPLTEVNLKSMQKLQKKFGLNVGVSDHTMGGLVPATCVALGGSVIEKHFILDKSLGGPDVEFSLDPDEFQQMIQDVKNTEKILGDGEYQLSEKARKSRAFMRSLYYSGHLKAGDVITESSIQSVRPGHGMHPKYFASLIGCRLIRDVQFGDRVCKEDFNDIKDL